MLNQSLLEIAYLRQQEMLQQAEAERFYRQLKGNRAGLLKQTGLAVKSLSSIKTGYTPLGSEVGAEN